MPLISFRELALNASYMPLPLFDPDPFSEDHWLDNMIEDRM